MVDNMFPGFLQPRTTSLVKAEVFRQPARCGTADVEDPAGPAYDPLDTPVSTESDEGRVLITVHRLASGKLQKKTSPLMEHPWFLAKIKQSIDIHMWRI